MKRADAQRAIDDAFAERIQVEFTNLGTGFEGTSTDRERAKERFANGINIHLSAYEFAVSVINDKFKDQP